MTKQIEKAAQEGELVFDPDYEGTYETDWDYDKAHAATTFINQRANEFADDMADLMFDAFSHRVWIGLGYESWEEWRSTLNPKRTVTERKAMVAKMRAKGMSIRAIGSGLGVSHTTVQRDLPPGTDVPPEVTGSDGKQYHPPTRTARPRRDKPDWEIKQKQVLDLAKKVPWPVEVAEQILALATEIAKDMADES